MRYCLCTRMRINDRAHIEERVLLEQALRECRAAIRRTGLSQEDLRVAAYMGCMEAMEYRIQALTGDAVRDAEGKEKWDLITQTRHAAMLADSVVESYARRSPFVALLDLREGNRDSANVCKYRRSLTESDGL